MFCSVPVRTDQLFTLIFEQQRPPYTPTFIPLFRIPRSAFYRGPQTILSRCPLHNIIYSVLAITCPFYTENGCTHTPIALAVFRTKLFRTLQSRETHIGVGGLWGGREVAFFGALAKGNVSSSIALAGRGFLPKSCLLIKYSPLCNLQTETFLQNPKHTFLPCVPKFMSDVLCGCGMLRKEMQLFVIGLGLLRPQDE